MNNIITWQDCLNAQDELIETVKLKIQQEPEHGELWQQNLAVLLCRRQEIHIRAEREKQLQAIWEQEQQFMQDLQAICENVLQKSQEQAKHE